MTKENAIMKITEVFGFATDSIIAFGDDYADIGMLELCGTGVAMGNAIEIQLRCKGVRMKQLSENKAYENYYQFIGSTKYRKNLFYDNEIRQRQDNYCLERLLDY